MSYNNNTTQQNQYKFTCVVTKKYKNCPDTEFIEATVKRAFVFKSNLYLFYVIFT